MRAPPGDDGAPCPALAPPPAEGPPLPALAPPIDARAPAPPIDAGTKILAAGAGMPVHLAATVGVLAFACSGEVVEARCGSRIEGDDGARALTFALLATVPPAASGLVVWALGDEAEAPASLPWTLIGGAAGQALGYGLAQATGSEAVALLSLTALPVAGELAALLATRAPARAPSARPPPPPVAPEVSRAPPRPAAIVPLATARFQAPGISRGASRSPRR